MKKNEVLFLIIGLLAGIVITWVFSVYSVNGNHTDMMKAMGMHTDQNDNSTNGMMDNFNSGN